MKQYTSMQLLEQLEARRELRNIMGRISHDYAVRQEALVHDRYWSSREDVCLGTNEGFYQGAAAVAGYYKALGERIALESKLIQTRFPEELGSLPDEKVYGVGMMTYLPFESQIIELAGDGRTAKGLWNVRGSYSQITTAGPVAYWTFGWCAVDFICEDGEWKIWHMQLVYNVNCQCGSKLYGEPQQFPEDPAFAAIADFKMPEPNVPCVLMETYHPDRPFSKSPAAPVAYETFADTFSYGV